MFFVHQQDATIHDGGIAYWAIGQRKQERILLIQGLSFHVKHCRD
jgi:hypothetical protein